MINLYDADLKTASDAVQGLVTTYVELLANTEDPQALDAFVNNLCGSTTGSENDRLWMEFVIVHHGVMRLAQGSDACLCLDLFAASNSLGDQADSLRLTVLGDLFAGLMFYATRSHPVCAAIKHDRTPPPNTSAVDGRLAFAMTDMINVAIAGVAWRELGESIQG